MSAFFDYLRNITYYLLFAALVGLIIPTGKYKKFVSLVMGLILLVIMLQPIRDFVGVNVPVTQWFSGIVPDAPNTTTVDDAYAIWRNTYLASAFEAQLGTQLDGLLERNGITLHGVIFAYTLDFSRITSVRVQVSRAEDHQAEPQRVPFIRIEPVQVQRGGANEEQNEDPLVEEVINLIGGFYNLPGSHIHVEIVN